MDHEPHPLGTKVGTYWNSHPVPWVCDGDTLHMHGGSFPEVGMVNA